MAAIACIHRVLLRAAELDWESTTLTHLEEIKDRLEDTGPCPRHDGSAARGALTTLRSATSRLAAVADVMKSSADFRSRMPDLVTSATAVAGQVARLRNGQH